MEPRSYEWYKARLSKITGSKMGTIMAGPKAWATYASLLREEMIILQRIENGEDIELGADFDVAATAWGRHWEPIALAEYSFYRDVDLEASGFVVHPDYPFIGCSIDSGVYCERSDIIDGIVETKCPYSETVHLRTLACDRVPDEHRPQMHTGIWIYGTDWGDFVSYDTRRDTARQYFCRRLHRDEQYIGRMESRCNEFYEFVLSGQAEIKKIKCDRILSSAIPQMF